MVAAGAAGGSGIGLDELTIAFPGSPDVAALWERIQTGAPIDDPRDAVRLLLAESRADERAGRIADACAAANQAIEQASAVDERWASPEG